MIYLLGYAKHLISHDAADTDALLEFIGSIIGAAVGPGLAVMGSFWLDQRRQRGEVQHHRRVVARALDQLAEAVTHKPVNLLSDVSGKINAGQLAQAVRLSMRRPTVVNS